MPTLFQQAFTPCSPEHRIAGERRGRDYKDGLIPHVPIQKDGEKRFDPCPDCQAATLAKANKIAVKAGDKKERPAQPRWWYESYPHTQAARWETHHFGATVYTPSKDPFWLSVGQYPDETAASEFVCHALKTWITEPATEEDPYPAWRIARRMVAAWVEFAAQPVLYEVKTPLAQA